MGCFASIGAPDLIPLNAGHYECLQSLVIEYNQFYENCRQHMKSIITEEQKIDQRLSELLLESKSSGSIDFKLAESYIFVIIFLLHQAQTNPEAFNFVLTNYIPGVLINESILPEMLKKKYWNLKNLCEMLPDVFDSLNQLSDVIIQDIVKARDEIPKKILKVAQEHSEISLVDFAKIERDWIDNIEIIGEVGKKLDFMFKNSKSCLRIANQVVKECNDHKVELKRLVDYVDEWNYVEIPKRIQEGVHEFIRTFLGINESE